MEDTVLLTILSFGIIIFLLFMIIAINFRWVLFGLSIVLKKFSSKNNVGLYFLRTKGGNFTIPKAVDLNKKEEEFTIGGQKQILPITREDFESTGLFFGMPYKLANDDDVKTSLGLVYHETNNKGEALYFQAGEERIPKWNIVKNSVSVSGGVLKALVDEKALSDALKDFLQKNQLVVILVIANIVVGGLAAYFGYEMMSNALPNIESILRGGFEQINNKLDLILEGIK